MDKVYAGVDVGKATLEVGIYGETWVGQYNYDVAGLEQLIEQFRRDRWGWSLSKRPATWSGGW